MGRDRTGTLRLRPLGDLLGVWLGISLLAFSLQALAPGDTAEILLDRQSGGAPSREAVQELRERLHLDEPFPVRYVRWLGGVATGDLGRSYRTGEPVLTALASRLPVTVTLAAAALLLAMAWAIPFGVAAALHPGSRLDAGARIAGLIGASVPDFWLGYLLILLFSIGLGILPVAGWTGPEHIILPAACLSAYPGAVMARYIRANLLEELGQDYVRAARARGLTRWQVVLRHALPNAAAPLLTVLALLLAHLLSGAVVVETVFSIPGLGKFAVDSIYSQDFPAVQGFVLFAGTVFLLINRGVDLAQRRLDPRIDASRSGGA